MGKIRDGTYDFNNNEVHMMKQLHNVIETGLPINPGNYYVDPADGLTKTHPPGDAVARLSNHWNKGTPEKVPNGSIPVINFASGMQWLAPDGNFYNFDGSLSDNTHQATTLTHFAEASQKAKDGKRPIFITEVGVGTGEGGADGAPVEYARYNPDISMQAAPAGYDQRDTSWQQGFQERLAGQQGEPPPPRRSQGLRLIQ